MSLATATSTDTCEPNVCGLGGMPHLHCLCGLPMALGDTRCRLCGLEGRDHYSRRRLRRIGCPPDEAYMALLITVLRDDGPDDRLRLGGSNLRPPRGRVTHLGSKPAVDIARQLAGDRAAQMMNPAGEFGEPR